MKSSLCDAVNCVMLLIVCVNFGDSYLKLKSLKKYLHFDTCGQHIFGEN